MVMNKNTYLGLALAAGLSIASTHLLAEVAPPTSATESLEPSELQSQQEERIIEPLEPSELQRQQEEHKKEHIVEPLVPSELQREQKEYKEERIIEPLEPSELQRQQEEHNKGIAK